jgi:uncharacterized protein YhaN
MRLRHLTLDRFGHFTGHALDFGAAGARPDFHIVYGPNEAGKTTTMEAALRLFYGFPHREPYAFKHQRPNLSVSGVLEIDGTPRAFTRLPKRSGDLLDGAGTALPEAALAGHLGGLGEEDYRNLLCLDDDTIERGGEEIAQARGDIGRLLFSAAAGVADLSAVLENVREEADTIWAKRKSKTRVAELKRALKEIDREIRERDVTASAWRGLKKALTDAQTTETGARSARDALHTRAADLAAQQRALPLLAELDALDDALAPFADYPERLEFDPETLVTLKTDETRAQGDIKRLRAEIDTLTAQRVDLPLSPALAALAEDLDVLEDLRARDRANALDLPRRRDQLDAARTAMARAARDLDVADTCPPESLVPSPAQLLALEAARDRLIRARTATATQAQELSDLRARRDRAQAELDRLVAHAPAQADIGAILARHQADALMPAHAAAQQAVTTADQAARAAYHALGTGSVRFDTLPDCAMSLPHARELAQAHDALCQKIQQERTTLARHHEDIAARQAQADSLLRDGQLVPDQDAAALRAERERLWQDHRTALTATTADAFNAAMQAFDRAQETRIAHASDLGHLRQIAQDIAEAQARATQTEARVAEHDAALVGIETKITAAAGAVGLQGTILPAEWMDWVTRHAAAQQAAQDAARTRDSHAPLLARAQALLEALTPHLDLAAPDITSAVAVARRKAEAATQARSSIDAAGEALRQVEADLTARSDRHELCQQYQAEAETAWCALVRESLGDAVAPDTLLAALDPLRSLATQEEKRAEAAQRVTTMERDRALFAQQVAALAKAHDLPPGDTPADSFARLRNASDAARNAETEACSLDDRLRTAGAALEMAEQRLAEIAATVTTLARAFPDGAQTGTLDALRASAGQAAQIIAQREKRAALIRRITTELDAPDPDTARTRLAGTSLVTLDAESTSCKADLDRADAALTTATETRVTAQQALAQVTDNADIARLTEQRVTLELDLQEAAETYLELSLGHLLADAAIRRYRDTHRSGMMAATERCFAALTQGAYPRLTTQPDGSEETLIAVAGDGSTKRAAEMSKGTRFQLYLALRAAAHEQLVDQGTRLPFFCDDIFETFDEDRTSAACRVMERIGQSGQAIYLTHHRHVVDIAQKVCDTAPIIHEIRPGS